MLLNLGLTIAAKVLLLPRSFQLILDYLVSPNAPETQPLYHLLNSDLYIGKKFHISTSYVHSFIESVTSVFHV